MTITCQCQRCGQTWTATWPHIGACLGCRDDRAPASIIAGYITEAMLFEQYAAFPQWPAPANHPGRPGAAA